MSTAHQQDPTLVSPGPLPEVSMTAVSRDMAAAVRVVEEFLDEQERSPRTVLAQRLLGARHHLLRVPGKMVRPTVVTLLGRALNVPQSRLRTYALAVELMHTATLLHDDVIDRSDMRRRMPTANAVYDNTLPILAGDSILAEVMGRVAADGNTDIIAAIAATLGDMVAGEAIQYELRGSAHCNSATCLDIARLKTGSLMALCTWIPGRLASWAESDLVELAAVGQSTGIAFQLIDDILDFEPTATGKPLLCDWSEGNTNAMTAQLLQLQPGAQAVLNELFADPSHRSASECARVLADSFHPETVAEARRRTIAIAREYADLADLHARVIPDNTPGQLFESFRRMLLARDW